MTISAYRNSIQTKSQTRKQCRLFWEITSKCENNCKFCFRLDGTTHLDLSYQECLKILASYRKFINDYQMESFLIFSGGDPLSREDFFDILRIAGEYQRSGIINHITILGNPVHINKKTVCRLKSLADIKYKLSLDGLEATHDFIRRSGSFKETLRAIRCLREEEIETAIAFVVSRINAKDLCDVIRLIISEDIDRFAFSTLTPIGAGKNLENELLAPQEYRKILMDVLNLLDELPDKYYRLFDGIISNIQLFSRLFYELDRWDEYRSIVPTNTNTPAAISDHGAIFTVLPDGTVYPRRLIPIKIGRVPQDSFRKIYESSDLLKSLEDAPYTKRKKAATAKCRDCPAVIYCGQGIACVNHVPGNIYGPHRMCWVE